MKFLNLILHAGLIILMKINNNFVVCGRKPLDVRLVQDNVVPQHYDILLYLNAAGDKADGRVDIFLNIHNTTNTICLHATNIKIVYSEISMPSIGYAQLTREIFEDTTLEIQTLHFKYNLKPGTYLLLIHYRVLLNDTQKELNIRQDVRNFERNQLLVFNTGLTSTRGIFPCWDEPSFKATFHITINHSKRYKVFSSMPQRKDTVSKLGTGFEITSEIPTHLLGIMITDFDLISETHDIITFWYNPRLSDYITFAQYVGSYTIQSLKFKYMIQIHTISKLDIVVLPGNFQTIYKWGLSVHSKTSISYKKESDSLSHKAHVAATVARGVIIQLMGNVSLWTDALLHEGMITFFQFSVMAKVIEKFPKDIFIIRFAADKDHYLIKHFLYGKYAKNITLPSATSYNRVPFILRMLQHLMTQKMFQSGINTYLYYSLTELDDLWHAFPTSTYEPEQMPWTYTSPINKLKDAIDTCFLQKNYPILKVRIDDKNGYVHLYLNVPFEDYTNDFKSTIFFTYTSEDVCDFTNTMIGDFIEPFKTYKTYIGTNLTNWIIVNLQQIGCYRVIYDATNWKKIAYYLNSEEYTKIHVLNRAQIIDDVFHFMTKKIITFPLFVSIISYLKRETDYTVWYSMEPALEYIWKICKNSQMNKLKNFMSEIWDGLFDDVGYFNKDEDTNFIRIKRMLALKWACLFGHTKCREVANTKMKFYLDQLTSKIPFTDELTKWTLCMGMMTADRETFDHMMSKYMFIGKDTHKYLACSENEDIITYYLRFILHTSEEYSFKNKSTRYYNIIVKKHAEKYNVLEYILNNFEAFRRISGLSTKDAILNIIKNVHSERNLYKIKEYLNYHARSYSKNILKDIIYLIDSELIEIGGKIIYFTL